MPRAADKYVLDTNLFVDAFREPAENAALQRFHQYFAPFEYLSAVVIQELRSGTHSARDLRKLERHVLGPFIRRNRVLTPSLRAWQASGDVLARLARSEGLSVRELSKTFGNDALLATSCWDTGMTLVTRNTRDFKRIQSVLRFRFVAPWPVAEG